MSVVDGRIQLQPQYFEEEKKGRGLLKFREVLKYLLDSALKLGPSLACKATLCQAWLSRETLADIH